MLWASNGGSVSKVIISHREERLVEIGGDKDGSRIKILDPSSVSICAFLFIAKHDYIGFIVPAHMYGMLVYLR